MKQLTSPDFRKQYTSLNEPVEVTVFNKPIGRWYPSGSDIEVPTETSFGTATGTMEEEETPSRFTIRPALRPRPSLVPQQQRIIDPLEMRQQARNREDEYAARSFGKRPQKS